MIKVTYHTSAPEMTIGSHQVTILEATEVTAATGTPQLHLVVANKAGALGHAYLPLTEKAAFNVCQLADAVGIAAEDGQELSIEPSDLIDKTCWVSVVQDTNGRKRVRRFYATRPDGPTATVDNDDSDV